MKFIVIDLESYFDPDYTFKKLSTEEYVRHPKFGLHGAAIKETAQQSAFWLAEPELRYWLKQQDWSNIFLVSHHAQWDHFALSHHYDVHPKMSGCTLSMARLLLGNHLSVSLDAVRKHFKMPLKTTPYHLFIGKRWNEMVPQVQQLVAEGACDEAESIWKIFGLLYRQFPVEELEIVDTIIKMFSEPALRADIGMLGKIWSDEATKKAALLKRLNVTEGDLQSAERFAQLLRAEGVDLETKQGKKGKIYAFAKNDPFMRDYLPNHDNERVRILGEARIGAKSTLMQTRAETLGWMARRGPCPVYLNYAGAGTLRVSGGDGSNWLNFKRGSDIRKSILAPEGYFLGPIDASQIECRVLNYLAGQDDVIEKFRKGEDPYVGIASQFYQETIYKPPKNDPRRAEMEAKRGMGKQGELMCGYGSAGKKFKETAKAGTYGPSVEISLEDANRFVFLYRQTHPAICNRTIGYWAQAERMLGILARGETEKWGPLIVANHRIYMPNGCPLIYDSLEWHIPEPDEENVKDFEWDGFWRMRARSVWKKMWGAKLTQNVCEAVSRVIVSQASIRIKHMGYRALNWPYDELLLLIPNDGHAEQHLERCRQEMIREVPWLPGIPLDCEGSLGERYSK